MAVIAGEPPDSHEGRPVYDCTQPVAPEVAALAALPIGEVGHSRKFLRRRIPQVKTRRKKGGRK